MLFCCNNLFESSITKTLKKQGNVYKIINFGVCPVCGVPKYIETRILPVGKKYKILSGTHAENKIKEVRQKENEIKHGTKSNQNFYYGDFKKTKDIDKNGLPVYLQLRKNLNGQSEIIGKVETKIISLVSG